LLHVITWVLVQHDSELDLAEPGFRSRAARAPMADDMRATIDEFDPDVLFAHRDAEQQDPEQRRLEIPDTVHPLVRIVPVRMTEAWLLFDEAAIRTAADNPRGTVRLDLPPLQRIEDLPDPKSRLREFVLAAADVRGRRRKRLTRDLPQVIHRIADADPRFRAAAPAPGICKIRT
jgi:hypothetical protein